VVRQIELSYTFVPDRLAGNSMRNPLMDMLLAIRECGSISAAAKKLGLSYRHVWGELKRWEEDLGQSLIIWEKGQPARLSSFGDKLLWAERQAQARLAAQISSLHAEMERAFAMVFDDASHVLSLYASHDEAMMELRNHTVRQQKLHLDIQFCGSVDAISALNEGRCIMAGFHTPPHPVRGSLPERTYKRLLKPGLHKLIGFARREQGLIVAKGNPRSISSLKDLARPGLRFVNRALGTGTRLLLDQMLAEQEVNPLEIDGYAFAEPSHAAVASAVAAGYADVGLGIEAAARAQHLDFVPLVEEDYYLVCLKSTLAEPAVQALLAVMKTAEWQQRLARMPGYTPSRSGEVLSMSKELPWWRFKSQKKVAPLVEASEE